MISVLMYLLNHWVQVFLEVGKHACFSDEEMELESHCCAIDRVDDYIHLKFLTSDRLPLHILVVSLSHKLPSKTIQDALAETVSILFLWQHDLPLQFLPMTIPFLKHPCNLLAIFKLLHNLILYFSIILAVEQAKFVNTLLVSSIWVVSFTTTHCLFSCLC